MVRYLNYIPYVCLYIILSFIFLRIVNSRVRIVGPFSRRYGNIKKKNKYFLTSIILIVISSIRFNTGSDYWMYYKYYNDFFQRCTTVKDLIDEYGYSALYIIAYAFKKYVSVPLNLSGPFEANFIFIFSAVVGIILMINYFDKHSKDFNYSIYLFVFLGYYLMSWNILKQFIAMGLLLHSYDALIEKKYVKYVLLGIGACLFHITAILPIILLGICTKIKLDFKTVIVMLLITVLIGAALPYFADLFIGMSFLGYTKYFDNFNDYTTNWGRILYVIGSLILYVYIFIWAKRNTSERSDKYTRTLINVLFVGILINAASVRFWLFIREAAYFEQFAIILIPNILSEMQERELHGDIRADKKIFSRVLLLYLFCFLMLSGNNNYYSYHTILNSDMKVLTVQQYIDIYQK